MVDVVNNQVNIELGVDTDYQLYDVQKDPSQLKNLASLQPNKLKELKAIFNQLTGGNKADIKEVLASFFKILESMNLTDFFQLTTFLIELNLTKRTRTVVKN